MTALPLPPNPDDFQYKGNPIGYQRAMYSWALVTKGKLEQALANIVNVASPAVGQIVVKGSNAWVPTYLSNLLVAGTGIVLTGTATVTVAT